MSTNTSCLSTYMPTASKVWNDPPTESSLPEQIQRLVRIVKTALAGMWDLLTFPYSAYRYFFPSSSQISGDGKVDPKTIDRVNDIAEGAGISSKAAGGFSQLLRMNELEEAHNNAVELAQVLEARLTASESLGEEHKIELQDLQKRIAVLESQVGGPKTAPKTDPLQTEEGSRSDGTEKAMRRFYSSNELIEKGKSSSPLSSISIFSGKKKEKKQLQS